MTTRELILRGSATLVVAMLCSLVCLEEAAAQWTFDENQCSPRTEHEILALPPPAAMIMVDRSGSMRGDKWRAAKSAISAVTQDMTQPEPDDLEFGLGLFYGSTAQVRREASPNAHSPIMSILNNESPNGGTPMANAIHTMRNSNTVQGNIPFTSTPIPIGNYSNGIDQTIPDSCSWRTSRIYVPGSASFDSVEMNLTLYERRRRRRCILWGAFCWWDTDTYNDANDFTIELRHDGVTKRISNSGQGGASTFSGRTINGFEHTSMQGWWDLRIRDCVSGNDGRLEGWGLRFVQDPPQYTGDRASAGILVTDGVPSYSRSGPVAAACAHRNEAPLYVVGLGSGTDREYNDVLAAAGGTGSCSNGDPCDNPNNWQVYDGQCDGSFQTSNANSLNAALSQIANEISCTFPLEVLGGGSVPPSNQGCPNYDCVKVVLDSGIGRIRHIDSPTSSIGPKGWRWASNSDRKNVKLSSTYCSQVQQNNVNFVETQVACLCQQTADTTCNVLDPQQCECETGKWACYYGTDVCEPNNSSSCPDPLVDEGQSCARGVGVCRDTGQTYCDSNGDLQCDAVPTSPEETPETTCDDRDNDCDGRTDEGLDSFDTCHVDYVNNPGAAEQQAIDNEVRRCNIGVRRCLNGAWQCRPLEPMPEVCNGIDDDCDNAGRVDNLNNSWKNSAFDGLSLDGDYSAAACYERNVCSCPSGRDDIEGRTYSEYLDSWANGNSPADPTCLCGEGLAP